MTVWKAASTLLLPSLALTSKKGMPNFSASLAPYPMDRQTASAQKRIEGLGFTARLTGWAPTRVSTEINGSKFENDFGEKCDSGDAVYTVPLATVS